MGKSDASARRLLPTASSMHACRVKITFVLLSSCHYVGVFYKPFNIHIYYLHLHSHMCYLHLHSHMWPALESACCRFAASRYRLHYYRRIVRSRKMNSMKLSVNANCPPQLFSSPYALILADWFVSTRTNSMKCLVN